jgi:hypothetical protein
VPCPKLHRIAFPVVSAWYQEERQLHSDGRSNGTDPQHSEPQSTDIGCHVSLCTFQNEFGGVIRGVKW